MSGAGEDRGEEGKNDDIDDLTERLQNATKDAPSRFNNKKDAGSERLLPMRMCPAVTATRTSSARRRSWARPMMPTRRTWRRTWLEGGRAQGRAGYGHAALCRAQEDAEGNYRLCLRHGRDNGGKAPVSGRADHENFDLDDLYGDEEEYDDDVPVYSAKGAIYETPSICKA